MINNTVSLTQYTTDIDGIVSDLSSQSTQIGQNTEAIGLKANQTDLDTVAGTVSDHSAQFLTMADEISAKVSADYVQTAIDDIEIGGRNLIGHFNTDRHTWLSSSGSIATNTECFLSDFIDVKNANKITITQEYKASNNLHFALGLYDENMNFLNRVAFRDDEITRTFEVGNNIHYIRYAGKSSNGEYQEGYKLEKGNKATDWSPAPEDIDAEISSLSAELSVQAGIIEGKAESTVVDAQGVRITTAEQTIDAIEGKISLVVSEDDKINAEAIASELSVTPSAIDLISPKINLSADQINFDGHVFGHGASFSGDLSSKRVEIGGDNPNIDWGQWTSTGLEIKNPIRVSEGNYYWDGVFEIGVGNSIVDFGFRDNSTGANGQFSFWGHSTFYSGLST